MSRVNRAASLLGKRSWQVRLNRFGLDKLRQNAAEMGRKYGGRPRLPDNQVTYGALYQRERRERLRRLQAEVSTNQSES